MDTSSLSLPPVPVLPTGVVSFLTTDIEASTRLWRGRPDHGWESLTPTERRVVERVAAGPPDEHRARTHRALR